MKNILSLLFTLSYFILFGQNDNDILMTVGDQKITVGEFKYIYEKNNKDNADYSEDTINEYLDLYKKFKLKVVDAKANGLENDPKIQAEINNYKNKLSKSYFVDNSLYDEVIAEAHERSKTDINVSHIFIKRNSQKAREIIEKLKQGQSFENLAKKYSQDPDTAPYGGKLGFLSAPLSDGFYALENAMYETPLGKYSDIIKTKAGIHIIKVNSKRPSLGKIRVAQITVRTIPLSGTPDGPSPKQLIDQAYQELKNGGNWNDAVKTYSTDLETIEKNGEIPVFGTQEYESSFEDAAFALKKNGEISKPIKTSVGYHIIKRLEKIDLPSLKQFEETQGNKIRKSRRFSIQKSNYKKLLLKKGELQENKVNLDMLVKSLNDEEIKQFNWEPKELTPSVLFTFNNRKYTNNDFLNFMKSQKRLRSKRTSIEQKAKTIYDKYLDQIATDYSHDYLTQSNPEYANLFREYKEGIILFETTKRNVWNKASKDKSGIEDYYNKNKEDYKWKERAEVIEYKIQKDYDGNKKKIIKCASKHKNSPEKVIKKFNKKGDFVSFAKATIDLDKVNEKELSEDGTSFIIVQDKIPARQKTLSECKGFVIADYQNVLEKQWLDKLAKKHKIKINNETYKSLIK